MKNMKKIITAILFVGLTSSLVSNVAFADDTLDFLKTPTPASTGSTTPAVTTPTSTPTSLPGDTPTNTTSSVSVTNETNSGWTYSFSVANFDKDYRVEIDGKGTFTEENFVVTTNVLGIEQPQSVTVSSSAKDLQGGENIEGTKIYLSTPNTISSATFTIKGGSSPVRIIEYVNRDTNEVQELYKFSFASSVLPSTTLPTTTTPTEQTNPDLIAYVNKLLANQPVQPAQTQVVPTPTEQTNPDLIAYVNKLIADEAQNALLANQTVQPVQTQAVPTPTPANNVKKTGMKENIWFSFLFVLFLFGVIPVLKRKQLI